MILQVEKEDMVFCKDCGSPKVYATVWLNLKVGYMTKVLYRRGDNSWCDLCGRSTHAIPADSLSKEFKLEAEVYLANFPKEGIKCAQS